MYHIESLTREEYQTLCWLAARGYDAGILELCDGHETVEGAFIFEPIPEHVAWTINERIEEDHHAFLTCNGSKTLSTKLYTFLEGIV